MAQGVGILVIVMGLIQIAPIKLDPFGKLIRFLGKNFHGSVKEQFEAGMEEVRKKLDENALKKNTNDAWPKMIFCEVSDD